MHTMANNNDNIDYKLSCRCCLKTDAEFFKLDAFMVKDLYGVKISLLQCLLDCLRVENVHELPKYICAHCSNALQVAYHFLQGAQDAHKALCEILCPQSCKNESPRGRKRHNGQHSNIAHPNSSDHVVVKKERMDDGYEKEGLKNKQIILYRCTVCGAKYKSRDVLKEHCKSHLSIVEYRCQKCIFITRKRRFLTDHYRKLHQTEPSMKQLEPFKSRNVNYNNAEGQNNTPAVQYTSSTLEDLELLIPPATITSQNNVISNEQENLVDTLQLATVISDPTNLGALTGDLTQYNVGAEFVVKPDGSLEQVMGNGVVIEYIDAANGETSLQNEYTDLPHTNNSVGIDSGSSGFADMDADADGVGDETCELISTKMATRSNFSSVNRSLLSSNNKQDVPYQKNRNKCNICYKIFPSLPRLKSHMLTHNSVSKYICEKCSYYTLHAHDLMNHYQVAHRAHLTASQAENRCKRMGIFDATTAKQNTYSCDLCLFQSHARGELKAHYMVKHKVHPTEVQLRPDVDDDIFFSDSLEDLPNNTIINQTRPDYVDGLTCKHCDKRFYWRTTYKEHLKQHILAAKNEKSQQAEQSSSKSVPILTPVAFETSYDTRRNDTIGASTLPSTTTTTIANNLIMTSTNSLVNNQPVINIAITPISNDQDVMSAHRSMLPTISSIEPLTSISAATAQTTAALTALCEDSTTMTTNTATTIDYGSIPIAEHHQQQEIVQNSMPSSLCAEIEDFIDGTDVAAVCTIPGDAIQVVEGEDIVIDNQNVVAFDFSTETFFEDFGEDEEEDDEIEDDDENKNKGTVANQNLLLTSDEDDLDDYDDERPNDLQKPHCIDCNKKFTSQYQFENHMFMHRGLAPYRCEMCTNIYNAKRGLIRHYKGVHKRMPTRDMVQAKGDKVTVDGTPIEILNINEQKSNIAMCAKCPYETTDISELRLHLQTHHGCIDDTFIVYKLPFECPRCIRSFAVKSALVRHLQRSHLVATIIEQTTDTTATTSITPTSSTTTITESTSAIRVESPLTTATTTSPTPIATATLMATSANSIDITTPIALNTSPNHVIHRMNNAHDADDVDGKERNISDQNPNPIKKKNKINAKLQILFDNDQ